MKTDELSKIPKLPSDVISFIDLEGGDSVMLLDISKLKHEEKNVYQLREQNIREWRNQSFIRKIQQINK